MILLQWSCSSLRTNADDQVTLEFLDLLVSTESASLSDIEKFYGNSSEGELKFEFEECRSRGWESHSQSCIEFSRERWSAPDKAKSFYIAWLKNRFLIVGEKYKIINAKRFLGEFDHELIEVLIGEHKFVLFKNLEPGIPTGLLIGISAVDGRHIQSYLDEN